MSQRAYHFPRLQTEEDIKSADKGNRSIMDVAVFRLLKKGKCGQIIRYPLRPQAMHPPQGPRWPGIVLGPEPGQFRGNAHSQPTGS